MATFLVKTEPADYSIDDLQAETWTTWDGVRNPQAQKALCAMQPGDRVLIYHSGSERAIVGQAQVLSSAYPDPADERYQVIDLKYLAQFVEPVSLREIKDLGWFDDFALVRQGRLSVMEVPEHFLLWFWDRVAQ